MDDVDKHYILRTDEVTNAEYHSSYTVFHFLKYYLKIYVLCIKYNRWRAARFVCCTYKLFLSKGKNK